MRRKTIKAFLRKFAALSLIAAMLVSVSPAVFVSAEEEPFNGELLLNRIGIPVVYDEEAYITRGDFVMLAVEALKIDHLTDQVFFDDVSGELGKYINTAATMGLVSVGSDKKFNPSDIITIEEAVTICLRVLGYDDIMQDRSYPTGYMNQAAKLGWLWGISVGQQLTGAQAADLIFAMLQTEYIERNYSSDPAKEGYYVSGRTYLEELFEVYKSEGTVTSICGIRLNGTVLTDSDRIVINGNTYKNPYYSEPGNYTLLGRKVKFYTRKVERTFEVIYIQDDSETLEIDAFNVGKAVGFDRSDSSTSKRSPFLTYYKDGHNDEYKASLDVNADTFINGVPTIALTDADFKPETGRIYLTDRDNDGDYDVIAIEKYVYYMTSRVDFENHVLFDKYNKPEIKLDEFTMGNIDIVDNDGNEVNSEIIGEFTVFEFMGSYKADGSIDTNKYARIRLVPGTVTGAIKSSTDKYFYINGEPYRALSHLKPLLKEKIGQEGTFYHTSSGLIVACNEFVVDEASHYGYLVAIAEKEGSFTKDYTFRIYTMLGKMEDMKPAQRLIYTGPLNGKYVVRRFIKPENYTTVIKTRELVMYEQDENGNLTHIQAAVDHTGDLNYIGYDDNHFSLDWKTENMVRRSVYVESGHRLDNAICFYVQHPGLREEDFEIAPYYYLGPSTTGGKLKIYNSLSNMQAKYAVIEYDDASITKPGSIYFDSNSRFWLIESVETVLDEEGDLKTKINVIRRDTRESLTAVREDLAPVNLHDKSKYDTLLESGASRFTRTVTKFSELERGDVIVAQLNRNGVIDGYFVAYEYDENNFSSGDEPYNGWNDHKWLCDMRLVAGTVTEFNPLSNFKVDSTGNTRIVFGLEKPNIMTIDCDNDGNVKYDVNAQLNLSVGDKVFVFVYHTRATVVIKYED